MLVFKIQCITCVNILRGNLRILGEFENFGGNFPPNSSEINIGYRNR